MSNSKDHTEREETDESARPTNALDPLGSPMARNPAFSSLICEDDPSTPERPRFPIFTQLPNRDTPLSNLRMPSPYPSSSESSQSTTPTGTPPRPLPAFGGSGLASPFEGLSLESTTPTNSPSSRRRTFLDGSGNSQSNSLEATTPTRKRAGLSQGDVTAGATRPIDIPPRPRLPSLSSNSRGIHPSPPLPTFGVTRTTAHLRKRGRTGENEEIDHFVTDGNQLDGGSEPRSPTLTATRLPSNFGDFEHEFRDTGGASYVAQTPRPRRPSDLNAEFERITNTPRFQTETPSPDDSTNPPPNSPDDDDPQPLSILTFRKGKFIPAGESPATQQREPSFFPANQPSTPDDRPSFRESTFFQLLDAQQQAHLVDSSAGGFYNLTETQMKLVAGQGVAMRDFAFESLMGGQNEQKIAEEDTDEAGSMQDAHSCDDILPETESSHIPAADGPAPDLTQQEEEEEEYPELARELSYRDTYGFFAYERMMKKKKQQEEDSSSSEDEWGGLVLKGKMGYGS